MTNPTPQGPTPPDLPEAARNNQSPATRQVSDARRLAERICLVLGILCLVAASFLGIASVFVAGTNSAGADSGVLTIILGAILMIHVALSVVYIVGSNKLKHGNRTWPLVILIVASVHGGLAAIGLVNNLTRGNLSVVRLITPVLFIASIIQLIMKLVQVRKEDAGLA